MQNLGNAGVVAIFYGMRDLELSSRLYSLIKSFVKFLNPTNTRTIPSQSLTVFHKWDVITDVAGAVGS